MTSNNVSMAKTTMRGASKLRHFHFIYSHSLTTCDQPKAYSNFLVSTGQRHPSFKLAVVPTYPNALLKCSPKRTWSDQYETENSLSDLVKVVCVVEMCENHKRTLK